MSISSINTNRGRAIRKNLSAIFMRDPFKLLHSFAFIKFTRCQDEKLEGECVEIIFMRD